MRALPGLVTLAATLTLLAHSAQAADPNGVWLTQGGKARVRIGPCGSALCGTIIGLKEPNDAETGRPKWDKFNSDPSKRSRPIVGIQVVYGLMPMGADKWKGEVYNAEDGKTYSGFLTLTGDNSLKLEGCALGGLICKAQTWTRAR
jgi:uncharacterized protein (DUF2147 family)